MKTQTVDHVSKFGGKEKGTVYQGFTVYTPPAREGTFLLVVGDVILWASNLATSAKSWEQIFNNSKTFQPLSF